MKTIRDVILERFVQKEINIISSQIADELVSLQSTLAHEIAREEDSENSDELKQKYRKINDLFISVAINSTCGDVSVDELKNVGIHIDGMIRRTVIT